MNIDNKKLNTIIDFIKERKTTSVKVLDIREISILADYFIVVSMQNEKGVETLSSDLIDFMIEKGFDYINKEGIGTKWVLLDFSDIVIHIFDNEYNDLYNLTKIWADAKTIEIE